MQLSGQGPTTTTSAAFEHESADFTAEGIFVSSSRGSDVSGVRQLTASPALALGG